jgi:putative hydrolase of the HAD superfamily
VKYEHIFFDLDRTLWDYDANAFKALTMVFGEFKLSRFFLSPEEFFTIYTKQNDQLWDDYRKGLVQKEELRKLRFFNTLKDKELNDEVLAGQIGERYMYITPRLNILFPSTRETLDYLQEKKYKLYILTNGFIQTQHRKMNHSDISRCFIRVFSSEELGVNKPKKEIFHWAVSSVHAKKKDCLMVGDDLKVDIQGAMNYGIDGVWFNPNELQSTYKPTHIIKDLSELKSIL